MIRAVRHKVIEEILDKEGVVSIADLAERFNNSAITVRRDLALLEKEGRLVRTHGGATALVTPESLMPSYYVRAREYADEKSSVAKRAAEYIQDGDSLIMNAGTTMHELAVQLRGLKDLKVVTNGLAVATELANLPGAQVVLIGGVVDFKELATVGPLAEDMMRDIQVQKAFLGVLAVSAEHGISVHSPVEAKINRRFLKSAREITVVADASKFGPHFSSEFETRFLFRVAALGEVDRIVTDSKISPRVRRSLEKAGPELVVVDV